MSYRILISAKIDSSVKDWIAEFALERRITMSEVLRRAIEEYLANHSDSEDEVVAAETIKRKREENVRLLVPKDRFDYFLFPCRVKDFVHTVRAEWEARKFLTKGRYDHLVELVEIEISVIKDNPHRALLTEMLEEIIEELREEQSRREG